MTPGFSVPSLLPSAHDFDKLFPSLAHFPISKMVISKAFSRTKVFVSHTSSSGLIVLGPSACKALH